jgi:hypothetical protein
MSAPGEKGTRVEACTVFLEIKKLEPKIHTSDTFSDEVILLTRDHLNKHNCICWVLKKLYTPVLRQHKRYSSEIEM